MFSYTFGCVFKHSTPQNPKMSSTMYDGASLASATGTRLDSGCKHIQQCRVSQDHMEKLVFDSRLNLTNNKFKYAVHKDELVLGIGKCWGDDKKFRQDAYPRVLSNLGDVCNGHHDVIPNMIKYMYHYATSISARDYLLNVVFKKAEPSRWRDPHGLFDEKAGKMPFDDRDKIHDFISVGYANTLGYAHAHSGDTMSSVMIGGLRTVMNGDFEVFCGDLIQWYWPFERDCFVKGTAQRKPIGAGDLVDPYGAVGLLNADPGSSGGNFEEDRFSKERRLYHSREFGQPSGPNNAKTVPLIKPYKRDEVNPRIYDWYRVFAVALCSARPNEAVDIRISRQAI